ncbi:kinase-like domain-containing protein [Mycena vitilis]|nr:kinase-like domain-containing protein [Mycena vitilis]
MPPNGTTAEKWAKLRALSGLKPRETWWVEHQPFLFSRGYALRPRYDPNWTPTWELPGNEELSSFLCEDSLPIRIPGNVLDAVRIADNRKVVLKLVSTEEMQLTWYLGRYLPQLHPDPNNRTIPLLDTINFEEIKDFPDEKYKAILVFPFLRQFDNPPFRQLTEVTEAVEQFLQGMQYMHAKNVAHRDLCYGNIMVDATRMIPLGWHFIAPYSHCGTKVGIRSRPRSSVRPVNYYIIDFGLSQEYFVPPEDIRVVGKYGQDKTVPELSHSVAYNPFKVDVYQLGNVIMELIERYDGLEIFRELAESMTRQNPDERPTASESVKLFYDSVSKISEKTKEVKYRPKESEDSGDSDYEEDSAEDIGSNHGAGIGFRS